MLKNDIEKIKQLFDALDVKQPALKNEETPEDEIVSDTGLEPVNFRAKPKPNHGLDKVQDKELEQLNDSVATADLKTLLPDLEGISNEDKELISSAIDSGIISNDLPDIRDMFDTIVDSGYVTTGSKWSDDMLQGLGSRANYDKVVDSYVGTVLLPSLKHRQSYGNGDGEAILHLCNACAKISEGTEMKCSLCGSENVLPIIREYEDEHERHGFSGEQWRLMDRLDKELETAAQHDDTYEWDTNKLDGQSVYDWMESNRPEAFQVLLKDPDAMGDDLTSEAFYDAVVELGMARSRREHDYESTTPEKHQLKIAKDTLKMSDAGANIMGGMNKKEARAFLKKIGWSDEKIAGLEESVDEEVIGNYKTVGRGLEKEDAEKMAQQKGGQVVLDDDEENKDEFGLDKKFMVLVKEAEEKIAEAENKDETEICEQIAAYRKARDEGSK